MLAHQGMTRPPAYLPQAQPGCLTTRPGLLALPWVLARLLCGAVHHVVVGVDLLARRLLLLLLLLRARA